MRDATRDISIMARYAAFLRGVSPLNAKMPELRRAFESAGFTDVATVISSGNVVFNAPRASVESLQRKAEAALTQELGRSFLTIVRPVDRLNQILASDPFGAFRLPPKAKRIVTFLLDRPATKPALPIELAGAQVLAIKGGEVFSAYVPSPKGAVFMILIERTFGKAVTTRTWDTVAKIARR